MATFRDDLTKYQPLIVHHNKVIDRLIATINFEQHFSANNSKLNSNQIIFIAFLPKMISLRSLYQILMTEKYLIHKEVY